MQVLSGFPEMKYRYRRTPEGDIRVLLYGHYFIAYRFRKEDIVEVLGVFPGALDMEKYL